jgi:hypothetical protein
MRTALALLLTFTLTGSAISQTEPSTNETSKHFRWSERQAHELDYQRTIESSTELSAEQKEALLKIIVAQLRHETFEGTTERGLQRLAYETRIEFVDLNGDGPAKSWPSHTA